MATHVNAADAIHRVLAGQVDDPDQGIDTASFERARAACPDLLAEAVERALAEGDADAVLREMLTACAAELVVVDGRLTLSVPRASRADATRRLRSSEVGNA